MKHADQAADSSETRRYRIELEGEFPADWASWFGTAEVRSERGTTVLELTVPDQAALHGALRRVHDLHLRLISLIRIEPD